MTFNDFHIELVKYDNTKQINALAALHLNLLPSSKPSRLGIFFLKKFYLNTLVKHNCIHGFTFRTKNEYIGFTLFTKFPNSFILKALLKAPLKYIIVGLYLIFTRPLIAQNIFIAGTKKVKKHKFTLNDNVSTGQWLTFGVKQQYLKSISSEGLRVSQYLVNSMINWFKDNNFFNIIAAVRKTNLPAIFFYKSMGFIVTESEHVDEGYYLIEIKLKE